MSPIQTKTALLVIDAQQSFMHRPYWSRDSASGFIARLQALVDRCRQAGIPVLQIFHVEEAGDWEDPFHPDSGLICALPGLDIAPAAVFRKSVHSAMFASSATGRSLDAWLRRYGIERLIVTGIRTEQCCETTTRHASDLGYRVTYAIDATLTFPMTAGSGRTYTAQEIMERTELVLAERFADVLPAEAIAL